MTSFDCQARLTLAAFDVAPFLWKRSFILPPMQGFSIFNPATGRHDGTSSKIDVDNKHDRLENAFPFKYGVIWGVIFEGV